MVMKPTYPPSPTMETTTQRQQVNQALQGLDTTVRKTPSAALAAAQLLKLQSHQQRVFCHLLGEFYYSPMADLKTIPPALNTTAGGRLQDTVPVTVLRTLDFPRQHSSKVSLSHVMA